MISIHIQKSASPYTGRAVFYGCWSKKPLHTGHNRRESFAEPSNCSANTHYKQTPQKPLNAPNYVEDVAAVNFRTRKYIVIVKAGNNNNFFAIPRVFGLAYGGMIMVIWCFLIEG
jgi:hypothetical protein